MSNTSVVVLKAIFKPLWYFFIHGFIWAFAVSSSKLENFLRIVDFLISSTSAPVIGQPRDDLVDKCRFFDFVNFSSLIGQCRDDFVDKCSGSPGNERAGNNQNASNDNLKDDHSLLVEWKDCDQLFNLYLNNIHNQGRVCPTKGTFKWVATS